MMAATRPDVHLRDVIEAVYAAFNRRDIEGVLAHMAPDVDWPNGMTGGREHGRAAVRAYWEQQWREIDPTVAPMRIEFAGDGRARVLVDQLVRDRAGHILSNGRVEHIYEFDGPFIKRMTIAAAAPDADDEEDEE